LTPGKVGHVRPGPEASPYSTLGGLISWRIGVLWSVKSTSFEKRFHYSRQKLWDHRQKDWAARKGTGRKELGGSPANSPQSHSMPATSSVTWAFHRNGCGFHTFEYLKCYLLIAWGWGVKSTQGIGTTVTFAYQLMDTAQVWTSSCRWWWFEDCCMQIFGTFSTQQYLRRRLVDGWTIMIGLYIPDDTNSLA
jgi:hypothetical protein